MAIADGEQRLVTFSRDLGWRLHVRAVRPRHQSRSSRTTKTIRPPRPVEQVGTPSAAMMQAGPWTWGVCFALLTPCPCPGTTPANLTGVTPAAATWPL